MMGRMISLLKKNMILLVLGIIVGFSALLLVHLLPTAPMKENVGYSLEMIEKEFTDEVLITGYRSTLSGNFTDCLMLEHAIYSNRDRGILQQALMMYRAETYNEEGDPDGWWPGHSLMDYVNGVLQPREVSYARYWHGYLVVLKPLLLLTTFNSIRLINATFQLILTGLVISALGKRNAYSLAKAFIISLPFLFFVSSFSSLSLSICLYLMLLGLLVQCKWGGKLYAGNLYWAFFLIMGMATSYFDFLTYPLVTLGYPLIVYFYFHSTDLKKDLKEFAFYTIEWFAGYVGFWASKWVLADLFTESTTIVDAVTTVFTRTQSAENASRMEGFIRVLIKNIDVYINISFLLLLLIIVLVFAYNIIKHKIKFNFKNYTHAVSLLMTAALPFVWYFVTQNHSEQHWQFTCRILAITIFAGMTAVGKIMTEKNNPEPSS